MDYAEYRSHDAVALARLIASGEVSAAEVLEAAIARAEAVNPRLNAIILPMYELARRRAAATLHGPLAGVPFLLKDLMQDYAGLSTAAGNEAMRWASPPTQHSEIVRRWLAAGAVVMGKTNTPEFGAKAVTEPLAFGATRNPWHLGRTPGGSSGGSAAAVSAGIVPVAGASDGGGSIRIPAACCGLFGLKPGRGLTPLGPEWGEAIHGAVCQGVVSRTVRDTAAFLDAARGPDPAGPFAVAIPPRPFVDEVGRDPGRLRIGFSAASPVGVSVHPEAVVAVHEAAELLAGLGHDVVPAEPAVDGHGLTEDFLTVWFGVLAATVREVRQRTGAGPGSFEPDTLMVAAAGEALSAADYALAQNRWHTHTRALAEFHQDYDLLLTPTIAGPPVEIGELDPPPWLRRAERALLRSRTQRLAGSSGVVRRQATRILAATPFTQLANVTGRPAMSVPLHWTPARLPLGVQLVAPLGGEGMLFRLAAQLEDARPWADLEPPLLARPAQSEPATRRLGSAVADSLPF